MACLLLPVFIYDLSDLGVSFFSSDFEEELGTDEESGKSWSELEEEASKGKQNYYSFSVAVNYK